MRWFHGIVIAVCLLQVHIKKKISDVVVGWEPMKGSNDRTMLFIEFIVHVLSRDSTAGPAHSQA